MSPGIMWHILRSNAKHSRTHDFGCERLYFRNKACPPPDRPEHRALAPTTGGLATPYIRHAPEVHPNIRTAALRPSRKRQYYTRIRRGKHWSGSMRGTFDLCCCHPAHKMMRACLHIRFLILKSSAQHHGPRATSTHQSCRTPQSGLKISHINTPYRRSSDSHCVHLANLVTCH